ncbi:MAG: isoprenyl transferase [Bacteroidota bacterium]
MENTDHKAAIDLSKVPVHVAIIMDGNGRWAKNKGEHRVFGHMNGVESVRASLTAASEIGVKYLTLYAFSAENWNRPKEEVDALMDLLVRTIVAEVEDLDKNGVRLNAIGDLKTLPTGCRDVLMEAIDTTRKNDRIVLNLALSYSSKEEIVGAFKKMAEDISLGKIDRKNISAEMIDNYLFTRDIPDPDLLIRTSGEHRISNFLLWQIAYSELYFTDTLWPDFNKEEFYKAILSYQQRERRFGKTSEQLTSQDNEI